MLRNTFFAVLTVLAAAASSQAATMLEATSTPLDSGLVSWTLMGVSTAGEVINGVNNPTIVPMDGDAGLHQVWQPVLGATPTRGDQSALFADAWRPYDSFWHFDTTNSLSVGGAFTETNSETGGKPDLPPGAGGPARTGYGTMGFATGSASKAFTIASGRQGTSVPFGQFVLKDGEQAMVSLGIIDNAGGNTRIEGFMLGGGGPPPLAGTDAALGDIANAIINHTFAATGGTGPYTWSNLVLNAGSSTPAVAATLSPEGAFQWHTIGSPRPGMYSWDATVTDAAQGTSTATLSLNLIVPEPASMSLIGLAMVGLVGFARRRS